MTPAPWDDQTRLIEEAAEAVRRIGGPAPRPLVAVTGTGLADLADALEVEQCIPFSAIPHMPQPGVVGHRGEVVLGKLGPLEAFFFCGRVHLYEGWRPDEVVFPVRVGARLGGKILLVTNATGGVNPMFDPGDLVLLTDQINLTFRNLPSSGLALPDGRATAMLDADNAVARPLGREPALRPDATHRHYDPDLADLMRQAARDAKIVLKEGIYAGNLGPTYETRAESAWLAQMNADVVGMSTIHETQAARDAGMRVVGLSCVANGVPCWGRAAPLSHDQVVRVVNDAAIRMRQLILAWSHLAATDANR